MKKTNVDGYVKAENGLVINTKEAELNSFLASRQRLKDSMKDKADIGKLSKRVDSIENKLDLILEKLNG